MRAVVIAGTCFTAWLVPFVAFAAAPASPRPDGAREREPEAEYPLARCPPPGAAAASPAGCSALSRPEPLEASVHVHDGFFFRGGFGLTAYHTELRGVKDRTLGVGAEVLLGGTPWPGVVIGGGALGIALSNVDHPLIAYPVFVQWYPDPRRGLHFQALAGYAIVEDTPNVGGPLGAVGAGYDVWVGRDTSVGVFGRVGYGRGYGKDGLQLGAPFASLAATFTWH